MIITDKKVYSRFLGMITRCYNSNSPHYKDYGGRGIKICDEWRTNYAAFEAWALSHGFSPELSIDRIDVNGPYAPDNCRWVDDKTQANNKRSNIVVGGVNHSMKEWGEITGQSPSTINQRRSFGWPDEKVIYPSLYPSTKPPAGVTLLRCPSCGSGSVIQLFRGTIRSRWVFGCGRCRDCGAEWELSEEEYRAFSTRPGVIGMHATNLGLLAFLHGDEVQGVTVCVCTRCGAGIMDNEPSYSFDLERVHNLLCGSCIAKLRAFLKEADKK